MSHYAPEQLAPAAKGAPATHRRRTRRAPLAVAFGVVLVTVGLVGYAMIHTESTAGHGSAGTGAAAAQPSRSGRAGDPYTKPELELARQIPGLSYRPEPDHNHVTVAVSYDTSPPTGGNHSRVWADCAGTVYPAAIANENAVHMLEHGAVWITYRPGLPAREVAALSRLTRGIGGLALSPYPDLRTNISLQAWGYQLFVTHVADPRIQQFIATLRFNPNTTPENGATCADLAFKQRPSTYGHPIF